MTRRTAPLRPARHDYDLPGWGHAELWTRGDVVLAHELTAAPRATAADERAAALHMTADPHTTAFHTTAAPHGGEATPPTGTVPAQLAPGCDAFVSDLRRRVHHLLGGGRDDLLDVPLDVSWCTPFQRDLLDALRAVPAGEVVTYGELAALAGRPGAARAAGTFCARNRFWLFVPCHRVVAHDGIGGYGDAGVELKRRLLELEGVAVG